MTGRQDAIARAQRPRAFNSTLPARSAFMARGTGLPRTPFRPAGPAARPGYGAGTPARSARDTGFGAAVKLAVRTRAGSGDPDEARCEACAVWLGRYGGEIQHIIARGSGGTSRPEISSVQNGALMCREGHALAESRDPDMYERGFWRWNGEQPGAVPLELHGADGGFTRWLTADGGYSTKAPAGVIA